MSILFYIFVAAVICRVMKRGFWLITTEHLEDRLWFRDEEDFKAGMNFIAIVAYALKIDVLAFILMSNHIHLVLYCTRDQALAFINLLKKYYGQYYSGKYDSNELLRRNAVDIRPLRADDESLERGIAYVHMNSVAANICSTPFTYPWGSGGCFFNPSPLKGSKVEEMSKRSLKRLLHSNKPLPPAAVIDDGYVLPKSYVNVALVESVFRTPKRMNYFLNTSSKARRRLEMGELPSFRDQIITTAIPDLCNTLFQKKHLSELSREELCELARQIRYRFSSDPHQIARVVGLTYEEASKLLDTY